MTKISEITECSECGSKSLTWGTHYKTNSGVPEGRLRSSEVQCLFVLGCDECSETLAIVSADKVAAALSAQQSAPERVSVPVELLQRCASRLHNMMQADLEAELRALLNGGEA